jgi:hypothetical protein
MTDVRSFVEVGPGIKDRLRTAIEALVDVLDSLEPDIDIEDDEREPEADGEESLAHWDATPPANGYDADLELDTADEEPVLGSLGSNGSTSMPQTEWARGPLDDRKAPDECEEENEHGGDPNDEGEPMLGSTTAINQNHAWTDSGWRSGDEAEPSLGWSDSRGHPQTVMPGYDDDREEQHDREHELTDDNGIGDMDGAYEQLPFLNGAGRVE